MEQCKDNSCDVCQEWGVIEGETCKCAISEDGGMFFECFHHEIPDDAYIDFAKVGEFTWQKRMSKEKYDLNKNTQ